MKKVLTNIDLSKNQALNVVVQNLAAAPSNPVAGQIYYDTVEKVMKQYDGTAWKQVGDYVLPVATADTLGGIKEGDGLTIAADGTASVDAIGFDDLTDHPTTLAGYGITDAEIADGVITLGDETLEPVVDPDYVHTDSNYTAAEKSKLAGIEAGAEVNDIDSASADFAIVSKQLQVATGKQFMTTAQGTKLDAIAVNTTAKSVTDGSHTISNIVSDADYVHTDNNYDDEAVEKLTGIEEGAEANVNADWSATSGDAQILNKPTTLAGYGITDAKIESGVITLGSQTITPLTEVPSEYVDEDELAAELASYLPLAGGTMTGILTLSGAPVNNLDAATKKYADDLIAGLGKVLNFKGVKTTEAAIYALTDCKVGDVWLCSANNKEYVCIDATKAGTADAWEVLGFEIDLSGYVAKADLAQATGTATDNAMSQKAVSDAIADVEAEIPDAVQVATGTLAVGQTAASVNFTGTFLACNIVDAAGHQVICDVKVGSSKVDVAIAQATDSALTISVVYK